MHGSIGIRQPDFIDIEQHLVDIDHPKLMEYLVDQAIVNHWTFGKIFELVVGPLDEIIVRMFVPDSPTSRPSSI